MGLEKILFKIRKRESPFWGKLKDILLFAIFFDFPAPRFVFRPIYELLVIWRFLGHSIVEKLFYVPVFKARCDRCGKGLSLPNGIPWINGHLKIEIGSNVQIDNNTFVTSHVEENPILMIGDRTHLGHGVTISVGLSVRIGNDCLIAGGCFIADNDGHPIDPYRRIRGESITEEEIKPVIIEDNVWIGNRSVILKGVTIGEGSVVAANSLVTRSIPPYSIAMGVPAKVVVSGINKVNHKFQPDLL
jgi:acetyltransferase-like isoleucine patch superfamily enzyme